jgi:hypothetical protein
MRNEDYLHRLRSRQDDLLVAPPGIESRPHTWSEVLILPTIVQTGADILNDGGV